jgi:O-antigen ligase
MRWLFVMLITVLIASDILGHNPGLGPGLSLKNALLYLIALTLMFRITLSGRFQLRMPGIHMAWAVWIGYAVVTYVAAALVIHYRGYDAIQSAIALKSELIDSAIFFLVVFYGVQDEADFKIVWRALAGAVSVSSILTLTDLVGITSLGTKIGASGAEADRVFGAFGHANETGALLVCMVPCVIAKAMSSRGFWRLFWYGGAAASLTVLILTVSRGAYVALVVGYVWAAFLCRRFIPPSRIATWVLAGAVVGLLALGLVSLVDPHVAGAIGVRLFENPASMGVSEASSGRTDIWALAINAMMSNPVTLFTGFGWDVYSSMPFVFVTHNTYLDQWFNLGLLGVGVFVIILWQSVATANRAAGLTTDPTMHRYMMAFVFGMLALAVAVFFANLYTSTPYIWMYVGLTMRGAVFVIDKAAPGARATVPVTAPLGTSWRRA